MYSLECYYYIREFKSLDDLINDVINSGMDPDYEITFNGEGIGEKVIDHINTWL